MNLTMNGQSQMEKGDFAAAQRSLDAVIKADPHFHPAYYIRAEVFLNQRKYRRRSRTAMRRCGRILPLPKVCRAQRNCTPLSCKGNRTVIIFAWRTGRFGLSSYSERGWHSIWIVRSSLTWNIDLKVCATASGVALRFHCKRKADRMSLGARPQAVFLRNGSHSIWIVSQVGREHRPPGLCAQRSCTPLPWKPESGQNVRLAHRPQACVPCWNGSHSIWIVSQVAIQKSKAMKVTKNIGMLLLAVYLIIDGLLGFGINFGPAIFLLYLVALAAGIFILIGK